MSTTLDQPETLSAFADTLRPARFEIDQYEQMVGAGVFERPIGRQRVELLEGTIVQMTPINYAHAIIVDELAEWAFDSFARERFRVRVQNPLLLAASQSLPEPDVAIVQRGGWGGRHPQPQHVCLVIEVADASLAYDLGAKPRVYAAAGIEEYWVVDLASRVIHVHRDPTTSGYRAILKCAGSQETAPLVCANARIAPARLFGVLEGPEE